jgi:hypothetical protein
LTTVKTNIMKPNNLPESAALIGPDWDDKSHAIALEPDNGPTETSTLPHSAESLHQWLDQLEQRFGARQVAVAIETDQGAVVYALLERPWTTICPIHPATSTRRRTIFHPSGAADDLPDALVLLSLLQHHRQRLRPLQLDDESLPLLATTAKAATVGTALAQHGSVAAKTTALGGFLQGSFKILLGFVYWMAPILPLGGHIGYKMGGDRQHSEWARRSVATFWRIMGASMLLFVLEFPCI